MASRPSKAQFNSSIRKPRSASNDLNRYGRRLDEAARRELDRESRRARSRLRQLPRSQPPVSTLEEALPSSVSEHVAADPVDRPHDVFLSQTIADLDLVRALLEALKELGAEPLDGRLSVSSWDRTSSERSTGPSRSRELGGVQPTAAAQQGASTEDPRSGRSRP